ncbi:MAG: hypothetical protein JXM71_09135 [Spirochaetales bacterium]|nr:hypothetical protein [Spirochaetales bacterium]
MLRSRLDAVKLFGVLMTVVASLCVVSAIAFEWPADRGVYRFGFGALRAGFLRGVEFGVAESLMEASDDGEMVFATEHPALPGGYPLRGNSIMAVAHASDMTTVYTGLEQGSLATYLRSVRKGDILGRSSAADGGRGAIVYVFDRRERRYINPLIVMPELSDKKPPVIQSISLITGGVETSLAATRTVRQGSYTVLLDVVDVAPSGDASAPYDIRILIDGSERARVVYDAAWSLEGIPVLFGGAEIVEYSYVADDGRLSFGPYVFSRGTVVLAVRVGDYSGNIKEQTYSLSIQ